MNILEVNRNTLASLYEQFPDTFEGLSIQGEYLVLGNEACDISSFNIYDLIEGNNTFSANLDSLTAEDVFRIIRLHTISLESKDKNEERLNIMKVENPLLRNVTIIPRNDRTDKDEVFNIVDSTGKDHVFVNSYGIDFFEVYENVKRTKAQGRVTPEDLIEELNRLIKEIIEQKKENLREKLEQQVNEGPTKKDEKTEREDGLLHLIPSDEFYELLRNVEELEGQDKKDVDDYYAYLGDEMRYEEYLLPQVMDTLNEFRDYIIQLHVDMDEHYPISVNQRNAINKSVELEERAQRSKDNVVNTELDYESTVHKSNERSLKLERRFNNSSEGFISTFAILVCIVVVVIILTIITLAMV